MEGTNILRYFDEEISFVDLMILAAKAEAEVLTLLRESDSSTESLSSFFYYAVGMLEAIREELEDRQQITDNGQRTTDNRGWTTEGG